MRLNHRTIRDDRGQRVHVPVRSMRLLDRHSKAERVVIEYYDEFGMRRQALNSVLISVGTPFLLICFGIFVLSFVYDSAEENSLGWSVFNITVGVTLIVAGLSHRYFEQRALHKLTGRRHLLPRLCPQCHYDLSGVPQESDGCTLCPECGAAWNLWDFPKGRYALNDVVDDRLQRVEIHKPPARVSNEQVAHRYHWLRSSVRRERWRLFACQVHLKVLVSVLLFALAFLVIRAAWFNMSSLAEPDERIGLYLIAGVVASALTISGLLLGVCPGLIVVAHKLMGPKIRQYCMACMSDLSEVSMGGDGCTVCPTCEAAWKLRL